MSHYDAIVLGVGGIGSAALYELARRGMRALGIDRFRPPHDCGSSHGQTRVIRQAYFEHPDYVPLLLESYRLWRELEQTSGRALLYERGLIQVGPSDGTIVPGVLRAAAQHRLSIAEMSAPEIERRWPGLRAPIDFLGVYEARAGYLLVEDCVSAHLDAAQASGAELLIEVVAEDWVDPWSIDGDRVKVRTKEGEFTADRIIVTAGAWAGELLRDLALNLKVLRKSLFWFETEDSRYNGNGRFPVYLFELPQGVFYGFPKLDPRGVKVGEHTGGVTVENPTCVDRSILQDEQSALMNFLTDHLPGVSKQVSGHTTCLYTMSPDEHFIVDRHPQHPNIAFAAGLSGHGFKFAPVLGRVLADLVLEGGTELPIGFLSMKRFA